MGILDVDQMLDSIPASVLSEWMAFDRLEPIGSAGDRYRLAALACMNRASMTGELMEPSEIVDGFRPDPDISAEPETDAELQLRQLQESARFA